MNKSILVPVITFIIILLFLGFVVFQVSWSFNHTSANLENKKTVLEVLVISQFTRKNYFSKPCILGTIYNSWWHEGGGEDEQGHYPLPLHCKCLVYVAASWRFSFQFYFSCCTTGNVWSCTQLIKLFKVRSRGKVE